jgi:pilus assembly protein CpaB
MNMVASAASKRPRPPTRPAVELDEVLVATESMNTGTDASTVSCVGRNGRSESLSPDFITRSDAPRRHRGTAGLGHPLLIAQGEPVRPIKLLGPDQSFMSSILPSGKRAVATQIAADTSAGGFILPDDYVDVIMTSRPADRAGGYVTETILENIRVLAIDQTIREERGRPLVQVGQTATLQLTPRRPRSSPSPSRWPTG